ncbi:MAG: DUF2267 domain-containing protein [Methanocella sp.]
MSTGISALDRAIQTAMQWLSDIQRELGWDSPDKTYSATRAVLQAIRDRLPVEEVVHLAAGLPLVMKGMLLDGYDYSKKPAPISTQNLFFELVEEYYNPLKRNLIHPETVAPTVIRVLNRRIGGGEMSKVAAVMPLELKELFREAGVEVPEDGKQAAMA